MAAINDVTPLQVHFVGSVPLASSSEAFGRLASTFPNRTHRIPDGETGKRDYFVLWQTAVFQDCPWVLTNFGQPAVQAPAPNTPLILGPLEYDDFALSSYADFCKLRDQGTILRGTRFQVCLPTPLNVIMVHINPQYRAEVEVLYEKALMAALRKIQDHIPKEDLAIQWDAALEFALIEDIDHPIFSNAWFSPVKEGLEERFARLTASVDEGVDMGFHLCYGDIERKHFVEPKDAGHLVEMANAISSLSPREINWVHMPVPKDRTDDAYFAPLRELNLKKETEVYLGLAHPYDFEATLKRIETARKVLDDFGIASECGFGRMSKEEFEAVIEVLVMASRGHKTMI